MKLLSFFIHSSSIAFQNPKNVYLRQSNEIYHLSRFKAVAQFEYEMLFRRENSMRNIATKWLWEKACIRMCCD